MAKNSPYELLPAMYTQADALKEAKDMSKNLVSGGFEREYREGVMEKPRRGRQLCLTALVTAVAVLAAWLLVLTALREVQLGRLRREVDELSADMLAMKVTVKSLNQKVSGKKLLGDFKGMEDTMYADIDQEGNIPVEGELEPDDEVRGRSEHGAHDEHGEHDSLEKLHELTVLESEDEDDDMYYSDDDEDTESGDWYPDYDKRSEKIGKTNMMKLKPEDFTGSVVTLHASGKPLSKIRELKRMLNEDPQNPAVFAAATDDMVTEEQERTKRSVDFNPTAEQVDNFAAPRFMGKHDYVRKVNKHKLSSATDSLAAPAPPRPPTRKTRNSDDDASSQRMPFIAAHFHGNTSHLSTEVHEHYKGNGLVRVSHDQAHDVWYPSPWTAASPHRRRPTLTRNGHVRVHHTGVYLVYVQIYYLDSHDVISWVLHRTNADIEGRETLMQCAQFSPSPEPYEKPNSCFSASALLLRSGDRLAVRNTGGDRHSLMQPEKSFIGLIKLADAEDPDEEL